MEEVFKWGFNDDGNNDDGVFVVAAAAAFLLLFSIMFAFRFSFVCSFWAVHTKCHLQNIKACVKEFYGIL